MPIPFPFFTSPSLLLQRLRDTARDNIVALLAAHVDPSGVLVIHRPSPLMTNSEANHLAWRIWFDRYMPVEFNLTPAENRHAYGEPEQAADQTFYLTHWSCWGFIAQCRQLLDEEIDRLSETLFVDDEEKSVEAFSQLLELADAFNLPLCLLMDSNTKQIEINESAPLSYDTGDGVDAAKERLIEVFEDIYLHDLSPFTLKANRKISFPDLFSRSSAQVLIQLFFCCPTVWNRIAYPHKPEEWQVVFTHPSALFLLNLMCFENGIQIILPDHPALAQVPESLRGLVFTPMTAELQSWEAFIKSRKKALSLESIPIKAANKAETLDSLITCINIYIHTPSEAMLDPLLQLLTDVLGFFRHNARHHLVECTRPRPAPQFITQKIMDGPDTIALTTVDLKALGKLKLDAIYWFIFKHYSVLDTRHAAFLVSHMLLLVFLLMPSNPLDYPSSDAHANKARYEAIGFYAQPLIHALLHHDIGLDTNNYHFFEHWLYLCGEKTFSTNEDKYSFFEEAFAYTLQAYLLNAPELENDSTLWQRFIKLIQAGDVAHCFLHSFCDCSVLLFDPTKLLRFIRLLTDPQIIPLLIDYEKEEEGNLAHLLFPLRAQIWPLLLRNDEFRVWAENQSTPISPIQSIAVASTHSSVLSQSREDQNAESRQPDESANVGKSDDDERNEPPLKRPCLRAHPSPE